MQIIMVDPKLLVLDPDQPRDSLNEKSILEYTARCKTSGMTKPVEVREIPEDAKKENPELEEMLFMVVNGAHRVVSSCKAGLPEIPVIVVEFSSNDGELRLNQLADNFSLAHTEGEILKTIQSAIKGGVTVYQVAQRTGKSLRWVQETMTIAEAQPQVREAYKTGQIGKTVALKIIDMIATGTLRNPEKSVTKAISGGHSASLQTAALLAYAEEVQKSDEGRNKKLFEKDTAETAEIKSKDEKALICVDNGKNFTYKKAKTAFERMKKAIDSYLSLPTGNGYRDEIITAMAGKVTDIRLAQKSLVEANKVLSEVMTKYDAKMAVNS